jgi:glycosyltransferase involved in cell wall biosynthesis
MKKILFYSYYWPPSGRATLHWPLGIIKYLPETGWQPTVITIDEDTFSFKDETLLKEVSPNLEVIKIKVFEPFNIYRKFLGKKKDAPLVSSETISVENKKLAHRISIWIRMNLFVPDARVGWYPYAVKASKKILKENKFDAIVSVGPPHSTHLIARKISRLYNIPHIPVFIDPWVDIAYYKGFNRSKPTLRLDNKLEKSVMTDSAVNIFVTESMKDDYIIKYPSIKDKCKVLYWGYNEEDFTKLSPEKTGEKKVILHAGNIFDYQNPVPFWEKIKSEIEKGSRFKLKFIGTVGPKIKSTLNQIGLDKNTEYVGFLQYREALQEMLNAEYLLVCATEKRHVPGKLFEYLRAGRPIIAFGDNNEEIKRILLEANAGMLFKYNENDDEFFLNSGKFKTDMNYVKQFDRKNIARNLAGIVNDVISEKPASISPA